VKLTTTSSGVSVSGSLDVSNNTSVGGTLNVDGASYLSGDVGIGLTSPSYELHVAGDIAATGDVLALSDRRVKTNVRPIGIESALARVLRMQGVTYNRSDVDPTDDDAVDRDHIGFVAQDLMEVVPEVVSYDAKSDLYSVNYGNMVALMAEAIKGLASKNDRQSAEIERQSAEIERQSAEIERQSAEIERQSAENAEMRNLMFRMDERLRRLEG